MASKEKNKTLLEIKKAFVDLVPKIEEIKDPEISIVIDRVPGLFESLFSIATGAMETIQRLKDEINRLKGEDGKAQVKANTRSSFSTEKERKAAEDAVSSVAPEIGFRLTKEKLAALGEKRIPAEVLDILEALKNKTFHCEKEFMKAITEKIGKKQADAYEKLLLKHGLYKKRRRKSKIAEIEIDRTVKCEVDKMTLPDDAFFTGHEDNIVQDIVIKRDNVRFRKEVYYSPSTKKTFMAKVPPGYEGGYGPGVKIEIPCMKYINNMSEPKILEVLQSLGIMISPTYISNRLTSSATMQPFIDEKEYLCQVAWTMGFYQQIDTTGCRVNGSNQYVQILCNEFYTAFFTVSCKDRLTILDIFRNFRPRCFIFNDNTFYFLEILKVSKKVINKIKCLADEGEYDENRLQGLLSKIFPDHENGKNTKKRIAEAAAIAHYRQDNKNAVISILMADDAPEFKLLTLFLVLCWVHIGRHFKKLNPIIPMYQKNLEDFQDKFWVYYGKLLAYKKTPIDSEIQILETEFDKLFSTKTGYPQLDDRIEKIKSKKEKLLLVLKYPEIPLHNNRSENGARIQKRRQDISLHTKSEAGTKAKDAMMSTIETCRKLGVNTRDFVKDRILGLGNIPLLGDLIKSKIRFST